MKELVKKLNQQVANFGVLYTKLHNFHWFVKGKKFYEYHELFEKFYDEVTEHFDEVAERILMLGETPLATLKEFLEHATIKEAESNNLTAEQMIQETINDFTQINDELMDALKEADDVTADVIVGIQASLQKHVWMLKALLM